MHRVFLLALGLVLGCSGPPTPPLTVKLAHAADPATARCFPAGPRPPDPPLTSASVDLLRLSVRQHDAGDATGRFLCDRLLQVPGEQPTLTIDSTTGSTIDLYAEAFQKAPDGDPATASHGPWRRVATGMILGIDLHGTSIPELRLYPVDDFRCVDARLTQPRALHSATALPTGDVVIVGGAVPSATDPTKEDLDSNQLYVTSSVEIYHPSTGSFTALPDAGILPRAFHQALLLNDTPPYQILLVGGVTPGDQSGQPLLAPNDGTAQYAARFAPQVPGLVPMPLPARAALSEILLVDPLANTATRMDAPALPASAFAAVTPVMSGVALAGGLDWMNASPTLSQADKLYVDDAGVVRASTLKAQRVGATLSPLFGDSALVLGGAFRLTPVGMQPADPIAEEVAGLSSAAPTFTPQQTLPGVSMTMFHTATTFASTASTASVLVTGGFQVTSGNVAMQPPGGTDGLHVLTVTGGNVQVATVSLDGYDPDTTCSMPNRYRPAGYESALALPGRDGEVLITGGSPQFGACNDCEDGVTASPLCALHQASRFVPPSTMSMLPPMQMARFGHTETPLLDGSVLIVGGLELPAGASSARVIADAEVFNPRQAVPRFDATMPMSPDLDDPLLADMNSLSLVRAPGDVARVPSTGMQAAACFNL